MYAVKRSMILTDIKDRRCMLYGDEPTKTEGVCIDMLYADDLDGHQQIQVAKQFRNKTNIGLK